MSDSEIASVLHDAYDAALAAAALEAFEGRYDADELDKLVDRTATEERALQLIQQQPQAR